MGRLFGTDGVRGIVNKELTCELTMKIGAAGAYVLTNGMHAPRILVGCDTRKSGDMLAAALSAGICSVGGEVMQLGVLPTPAMAYLVRMYDADAAVMMTIHSAKGLEFDHVFLGSYDGPITLNEEEASEIKWVALEELKKDVVEHPERYTSWFLIALHRVIKHVEGRGV